MLLKTDTIAAIATAQGQGGIGIIRVSGPNTQHIAHALLGTLPAPRQAHFASFLHASGEVLDQGLALFFPHPHSFTGEDILELQGHGGPVILERVLNAVLLAGARLAEPGEFSKRAFLNEKIDLAQAEAIADLIACQSEEAAQAAMRSLSGLFSQAVHTIVEQLISLRMYVESAIDFPEEEIDFLADGLILSRLNQLLDALYSLQNKAKQGSILRDGIRVVIAGKPNAGKSSLLNALSGEDSAIVTSIPGTTRDILKEHIVCDGIPIHILDTAGLRDSHDVVEQEGIRRTKQALKQADGVLLMIDATTATKTELMTQIHDMQSLVTHQTPIAILLNKSDLITDTQQSNLFDLSNSALPEQMIYHISAKTHAGLDQIKKYFKHLAGMTESLEGCFLARTRHLDAIAQALAAVLRGKEQLVSFKAGELLAEELRTAQLALATITGQFTADDLLGKIFSHFCIGK